MSSAILYLAIVAIWACVLIPRWLKRDSARGVAPEHPLSQHDGATPDDTGAGEDDTASAEDADADHVTGAPRRAAEPLSPEESRRRMLAARRRLLLMLIMLEIAAVVLAMLSLAAIWVVVPPTIMLVGYVLLLREAAAAERERAEREAADAARRRERRRTHPAARPATAAAAVSDAKPTAEELAAKFAAAPVAADYEDSAVPGRDFAPGLAGKYTTSHAEAQASDDDSEGYEPPRLRAVGD